MGILARVLFEQDMNQSMGRSRARCMVIVSTNSALLNENQESSIISMYS